MIHPISNTSSSQPFTEFYLGYWNNEDFWIEFFFFPGYVTIPVITLNFEGINSDATYKLHNGVPSLLISSPSLQS